jgi:hypothetical protein
VHLEEEIDDSDLGFLTLKFAPFVVLMFTSFVLDVWYVNKLSHNLFSILFLLNWLEFIYMFFISLSYANNNYKITHIRKGVMRVFLYMRDDFVNKKREGVMNSCNIVIILVYNKCCNFFTLLCISFFVIACYSCMSWSIF